MSVITINYSEIVAELVEGLNIDYEENGEKKEISLLDIGETIINSCLLNDYIGLENYSSIVSETKRKLALALIRNGWAVKTA